MVGALPKRRVFAAREVPIIFLLTDCWSLGLVLTKARSNGHDRAFGLVACCEVIWRLVQSDVILHNLHREPGSLLLSAALVLLAHWEHG